MPEVGLDMGYKKTQSGTSLVVPVIKACELP